MNGSHPVHGSHNHPPRHGRGSTDKNGDRVKGWQHQGEHAKAGANVTLSVVLCLAGCWLGMAAARQFREGDGAAGGQVCRSLAARVDSTRETGNPEMMLTKTEVKRQALELPPEERVELVVEIWNSLQPEDVPVPIWQRDLIRERLEALEGMDPEERSSPWEEVRERVFPGKK